MTILAVTCNLQADALTTAVERDYEQRLEALYPVFLQTQQVTLEDTELGGAMTMVGRCTRSITLAMVKVLPEPVTPSSV